MILRNDWWWSSSVAMSCLSFSPLRLGAYIWLYELLLKVAWQIINGLAASHFKHSWSAPPLASFKNCSSKDQQNEFEWLLNPQHIPMTGKIRQQIHHQNLLLNQTKRKNSLEGGWFFFSPKIAYHLFSSIMIIQRHMYLQKDANESRSNWV